MRALSAVAAVTLLFRHVAAVGPPAYGVLGPDLLPRFYASAIRAISRQEDGTCPAGNHSCLEINSTQCCGNDRYCFITSDTFEAKCCSFGNDCNSQCGTLSYEVPDMTATIIITTKSPPVTTIQTGPGCSPRSCTSTNFLCPKEFGGKCCAFGAVCASGGNCIAPVTSSTSTSSTPYHTVVFPVAASCTATAQVACDTNSGGGCCATNQGCMPSGTTNVCTPSQTGASPTDVSAVSSGGLSDGAKGGIGAAIAIVALLIIGAITWFCIRRRRDHRRSVTATGTSTRYSGRSHWFDKWIYSGPPIDATTATNKEAEKEMRDPYLHSELYASSAHLSSGRPGAAVRTLSDGSYFGSEAMMQGPFSGHTSAGTSPDYHGRPSPNRPEDISNPVEMGRGASVTRSNRLSELAGSDVSSIASGSARQMPSPQRHSSIAGRFELYGSRQHSHDVVPPADQVSPDPEAGHELGELASPSPIDPEQEARNRRF